MKRGFLAFCGALLIACPAPSRAEESCLKAYESAAQDYWLIVNDMLTFKVMFDEYDRLCTQYYPEQIEALQPSADLLRKTVKEDIGRVDDVMEKIFTDVLPSGVPDSCRADTASRDEVKTNFLSEVSRKSKTVGARLQKSALTLHDPKDQLKLCRELKPLSKKIVKKLGPDLNNPLLEMSALHSRYITKDSGRRKEALAHYRSALKQELTD